MVAPLRRTSKTTKSTKGSFQCLRRPEHFGEADDSDSDSSLANDRDSNFDNNFDSDSDSDSDGDSDSDSDSDSDHQSRKPMKFCCDT
jgi:hypothetical protein